MSTAKRALPEGLRRASGVANQEARAGSSPGVRLQAGLLPVALDRIDLRILSALQESGRLTNQELADRVALSPSPCLRRVRRLEEAGVIDHYAALLDPARVGLGLLAYVNVKLEKRATARGRFAADDFRDSVLGWPEVVECYATTGDSDYLMRVYVCDLAHFSRFAMDTLLRHPGVLDVRSSFALQRIKDTTALPLGHLV